MLNSEELLSNVAASVCILASNVWEFQLFHILPNSSLKKNRDKMKMQREIQSPIQKSRKGEST